MLERDLEYELMFTNGMLDELEKIAVAPGVFARAAKAFAARPEAGALGQRWLGRFATTVPGAAIGATTGAVTAPEEYTKGQRVARTIKGGLLGAGAGLAGGQFVTRAGREQAKRVGQQQLHGITGYRPGRGIFGTKGFKQMTEAQQKAARVQAAHDMGIHIPATKPANVQAEAEKIFKEREGKKFWDSPAGVLKALPEKHRRWFALQQAKENLARYEAVEKGLSSAPGIVGGLVRHPIETIRTGGQASGLVGLGITGAYGASVVPGMVSGKGWGSDYSHPGGAGRLAGESLAFSVLGPTPLGGVMALSSGLGAIGSAAQRGTQKAVGAIRPPTSPAGM